MKKTMICITTACLLFAFQVNEIKASNHPVNTECSNDSVASKNSLLNRLEEINAMDKSHLSRNEKKALRKEVHLIDKNIRSQNGGVYISVGGLLLIVLLLIILL